MLSNLAFLDFSTTDLVIILIIILLLFGSRKLPELSRSLGQSAKELRKGMGDSDDDKNKNQKTIKSEKNSTS